jgi:hypothetical protein
MTDERFKKEVKYRAALALAREMRTAGAADDSDLEKIKAFFGEKYQPISAAPKG